MADISVIIPVFNGANWIDNCMKSIADQSILINNEIKLEIVVFNDGSNDNSAAILEKWSDHFTKNNVMFINCGSSTSRGVGAAKNGAVKKSTGEFLCFQDVDDVMCPDRILRQWEYAKYNHNALIGCRVSRTPRNSTPRFVKWANNLSLQQLKLQIYTSNGPTVLMPTWFCHKSVYARIEGFDETRSGIPEDLLFFYAHLDAGGDIHRIDAELLIYTYHKNATTFSIKRETIWQIQLERLEQCVLPYWRNFTIWNAGKAGKKLVRSLCKSNLKKIIGFCDIDKNKIGRTVEIYCPIKRTVEIKLSVVHFRDAKPPLLICVKLDLTGGEFERNLQSLQLTEGKDYILFS